MLYTLRLLCSNVVLYHWTFPQNYVHSFVLNSAVVKYITSMISLFSIYRDLWTLDVGGKIKDKARSQATPTFYLVAVEKNPQLQDKTLECLEETMIRELISIPIALRPLLFVLLHKPEHHRYTPSKATLKLHFLLTWSWIFICLIYLYIKLMLQSSVLLDRVYVERPACLVGTALL